METRRILSRIIRYVALALVAGPATASAQIVSNISSVSLSAALPQSITVSVTSGSTVNFTLANGSASTGDAPAVIQTSWNLIPAVTGAVSLFAYFDTPSQALGDGSGNYVTSSLVAGRMTTGTPTSYTAITQTNAVGPAGGSLALFSESITALNAIKTRTDNLDLRIDLTGQSLPAGSYSGTLRIQARAI